MSSTAQQFQGWVPVDFCWGNVAGAQALENISWMNLSGISFSEPFFLQTLSRIKSDQVQFGVIRTKPNVLTNILNKGPISSPSGIIFHLSRSGSTALANCLKISDRTQVVSEYWPLTQVNWKFLVDSDGSKAASAGAEESHLAISASIECLATCRTGHAEKVVLKLTSSSLLNLPRIRTLWPHVPLVLLIRDPKVIAMKSLKGGGWMDLIKDPQKNRLLSGLGFDESTSISTIRPEEFAARVLGNYLRVAKQNIELFDLIICHEELAPQTVQEVADLFRLSAVSNTKIRRCLSCDAKSEGKTPYVADCDVNTSAIEFAVKREVEKHATPVFRELVLSISKKQKMKMG